VSIHRSSTGPTGWFCKKFQVPKFHSPINARRASLPAGPDNASSSRPGERMARGPAKRREGLRDFSPVETDDAGRSKTRSERSHDRHFACDEVAQADFNRREAEERNNGRERGQTRNEAEGYLKLAADAEKDRAPSGSLRSCNSVERSRHIVRSATVFPVVGFTRADTRPFGWRFRPNSQLMVKKYLRPAGPPVPNAAI